MNKIRIALRRAAARGALLAGCATEMGGGGARAGLGHPLPSRPAGRARRRSRSSRSTRPTPTASNSGQIAAAVERELARLGWTVVPTHRPVRAGRRGPTSSRAAARPQRSGLSIGIGVGGGSYGRGGGVGGGVGATIPVGGGRRRSSAPCSSVRIQRRSDAHRRLGGPGARSRRAAAARWRGRAAAVDRLAAALFRDFPGESGRTIRVR